MMPNVVLIKHKVNEYKTNNPNFFNLKTEVLKIRKYPKYDVFFKYHKEEIRLFG